MQSRLSPLSSLRMSALPLLLTLGISLLPFLAEAQFPWPTNCGPLCLLQLAPITLPSSNSTDPNPLATCTGTTLSIAPAASFTDADTLLVQVPSITTFCTTPDNLIPNATIGGSLSFTFRVPVGTPLPTATYVPSCTSIWSATPGQDPAVALIASALQNATCSEIRSLFEDGLQSYLGYLAGMAQQYLSAPVPPPAVDPVPILDPPITSLRDNAIVNLGQYVLNTKAKASGINEIVQSAMASKGGWANTSGTVGGAILGAWVDLGVGDFIYQVTELNFTHVGNFSSLDAFEPAPEDDYTVVIKAGLDRLAFDAVVLLTSFDINNPNPTTFPILGSFSAKVRVRLDFANPSVVIRLRSLVEGGWFSDLPSTSQLLDWHCLVNAVKALNISQFVFNASAVNLAEVSLLPFGDIEPAMYQLIEALGDLLTRAYLPAIPALGSGVYLQTVTSQIFSQVSGVLNNNFTKDCPAPIYPEKIVAILPTTVAFALCLPIGMILAIWVIYLYPALSRRAGRNATDAEERAYLNPAGSPGYSIAKEVNQEDLCLMQQPTIPLVFRLCIPVLLLSNMALFISSNTSVGASVLPVLKAGNFKATLYNLFDFGLANSIHDMWAAKVYPLAILIATLSGAWPYIKLCLMLISWVAPPCMLPVKTRELLLMALDALGKWSLIDVFVMTLMLIGFRFHLDAPSLDPSNPGLSSSADIFVAAEYGFCMFVIATVLSLTIGHFILAFHRNLEETRLAKKAEESGRTNFTKESPIPLRSIAFTGTNCSPVVRGLLEVAVVVLLIGALVCICVGISFKSVEFRYGGAAGWALDNAGGHAVRTFSLIDIGLEVPRSCEFPDTFPPKLIEAAFFLTCVAMPTLQLMVLLLLWLVPMKYAWQRRVFVIAEILNAWAAIEVYIVGIIAALLEIRQFTQFMVGDKCNQINPILGMLLDKELHGEDICFDVQTKLLEGSWTLVAACVMYLIASITVMRRCHHALQERNAPGRSSSPSIMVPKN